MEHGFGNIEKSIMKGMESSPLFQAFSQFMQGFKGGGGGQDGGKGPETVMSEITKGLENTAKLFES